MEVRTASLYLALLGKISWSHIPNSKTRLESIQYSKSISRKQCMTS